MGPPAPAFVVAHPRPAPGVEFLGPYRDSGLEDPPYLIARHGTILQVSRLLYVVAAAADGGAGFDDIAARATTELGRQLSADDARYLIEEKLAPAGIVAPNGTVDQPPPRRATDNRALALRFRWALVPADAVNDVARALQGLFFPPVVAGVLVAVVGLDAWVFGVHGVRGALEQVVRQPGLLGLVLALTWLSIAFHELGHAAACRYSGARPGPIGAGVYLIWPVLYTNVTDSYRLGRLGRLRTDLGGIYFNAVFMVVLFGAYAATGFEPLLPAVVVQNFLILDQLMPWIRLDGHYIISDLTGVPDILGRVRPALRSLIPGRPRHPDVAALRPGPRRLLFAYLGSLAIFVAFSLAATVVQGPRLITTGWDSLPTHVDALETAIGMWDLPMGLLVLLQIAVVVAPAVGFVLTVGFLASRLVKRLRRSGRDRPIRTAGLRSG
jgi:putative peptide zinc metalloprotease protein